MLLPTDKQWQGLIQLKQLLVKERDNLQNVLIYLSS